MTDKHTEIERKFLDKNKAPAMDAKAIEAG